MGVSNLFRFGADTGEKLKRIVYVYLDYLCFMFDLILVKNLCAKRFHTSVWLDEEPER